MSTKKIKLYEKLLYVTQFVVDHSSVEALVNRLPRLLSQLGVKNGDVRVGLIDHLNLFLVDLKNTELKTTTEKTLAKTTRKLFKVYLLVLGLLVNLKSWKNIFVSLKTRDLSALTGIPELAELNKIALSISSLASLTPLVKHVLATIFSKELQASLASFLTTYGSLTLFPEGFSKDYLSVYSFFYGVESTLNFFNDKYNLGVRSSWFLVPFSLSELFHNYIVHPEHTPKVIKKLFDSLLSGLIETKPAWVTAGKWPTVGETIIRIREASVGKTRRVRTVLVHSQIKEIKRVQPHPLHTNNLLSITNPSEPRLLKIFARYLPKRFMIVTLALFPLFVLKSFVQGEFYDLTPEETLKRLSSPLKSTLKLSSTVLLTTITAFILLIKSNSTRTPVKNFRIIGFLAGLWGLLYRDTAAKPLTTFFARITLLSTKRRLQQKYGLKYVDPLLGGIGISALVTLYDSGLGNYISPARLVNYLKLIV